LIIASEFLSRTNQFIALLSLSRLTAHSRLSATINPNISQERYIYVSNRGRHLGRRKALAKKVATPNTQALKNIEKT
jgi:hypothetical protein